METAYYNTTRRAADGTVVYYFPTDSHATVQSQTCLGLDYAPVLLMTSDGSLHMVAGTYLPHMCGQFPHFLDALQSIGASEETIQIFKDNWVSKTDRESQRPALLTALNAAIANGTTAAYLDTVKSLLLS